MYSMVSMRGANDVCTEVSATKPYLPQCARKGHSRLVGKLQVMSWLVRLMYYIRKEHSWDILTTCKKVSMLRACPMKGVCVNYEHTYICTYIYVYIYGYLYMYTYGVLPPLEIRIAIFLLKEVKLNTKLNSTQIRNIQGDCSVLRN